MKFNKKPTNKNKYDYIININITFKLPKYLQAFVNEVNEFFELKLDFKIKHKEKDWLILCPKHNFEIKFIN